MFNISIILRNSAMQFLCGFKTHAAAYDAREEYKKRLKEKQELTVIKDDFGMELQVFTSDIQVFLIEDADHGLDAARERDIAKRQEQARFMKRRQDNIELMHLYPQQPAPQGGFQNA